MARKATVFIASLSPLTAYTGVILYFTGYKMYAIFLAPFCMVFTGAASYLIVRTVLRKAHELIERINEAKYLPETPPPAPIVDALTATVTSAILPPAAGYIVALVLSSLEDLYSWVVAATEHVYKPTVNSIRKPSLLTILSSIILLGLPVIAHHVLSEVERIGLEPLSTSQALVTSKT